MSKTLYLLSNHFDYSKMICNDNGPGYAKSMKWEYESIRTSLPQDTILVFDNRLSFKDLPGINEVIRLNSYKLVFKVVDGMEEAMEMENNKLLASINPGSQIYFYSPYQDSYLMEFLRKKHGEDKVFTLPYPYDKGFEVTVDLADRKNQVAITGALNANAYPLRWYFHTSTYHKLWAWNKVRYLKHPGYIDIGFKQKHNIVGKKYLDFLAHHVFMLVTTNKFDYELLKYKECAYAGCVLVGDIPTSLKSLESKLPGLINSDIDVRAFLSDIVKMDKEILSNSIMCYREWFRRNRNPEVLNKAFYSKIGHGTNISA
jgi:hypothetical protein